MEVCECVTMCTGLFFMLCSYELLSQNLRMDENYCYFLSLLILTAFIFFLSLPPQSVNLINTTCVWVGAWDLIVSIISAPKMLYEAILVFFSIVGKFRSQKCHQRIEGTTSSPGLKNVHKHSKRSSVTFGFRGPGRRIKMYYPRCQHSVVRAAPYHDRNKQMVWRLKKRLAKAKQLMTWIWRYKAREIYSITRVVTMSQIHLYTDSEVQFSSNS